MNKVFILQAGRSTDEGSWTWNVRAFNSATDANGHRDTFNLVVEMYEKQLISLQEAMEALSPEDVMPDCYSVIAMDVE